MDSIASRMILLARSPIPWVFWCLAMDRCPVVDSLPLASPVHQLSSGSGTYVLVVLTNKWFPIFLWSDQESSRTRLVGIIVDKRSSA
jgi:hypothetical protein